MSQFLPDAVFTVAEFLDFTNELLKPLKVTIQGEITSISHREKATYFSLNDKQEKAKLDCVIWRYKLRSLGFDLEEGQEVQIVGAPNIYKPMGKFSVVVEHVSPVGEGALRQAFEKLKLQLEQAGFFRLEVKKTLPRYPEKIGVITSEYGDAIKDFLTHLGQYGFQIQLIDTRVEGLQAIDSIVRSIRWFNEHPESVEVLVLTRGGGSLESLQAFNSEQVAKAIFSSKIPIISAVGHENDVTIADLVADVRASTPTDAGKILSQYWSRLEPDIDQYEANIEQVIRQLLTSYRQQLRHVEELLLQRFQRELQQQTQQLATLQLLLLSHIQQFLDRFSLLRARFSANFRLWQQSCQNQTDRLSRHTVGLVRDFARVFERYQQHVHSLSAQLRLADPELKLKQGYSIVTTTSGTVLCQREQVQVGDHLRIKTHQARIEAQVEAVE